MAIPGAGHVPLARVFAPPFNATPSVINGFSDLMAEVFGPTVGVGARSAVGMAELPFGLSVEVEAIFELHPEEKAPAADAQLPAAGLSARVAAMEAAMERHTAASEKQAAFYKFSLAAVAAVAVAACALAIRAPLSEGR